MRARRSDHTPFLRYTTNMSQSSRQLSLVIGSGSVKCAAALGVLQVLQEAGIKVNLIVGCSGGAIYAAAIAMGLGIE